MTKIVYKNIIGTVIFVALQFLMSFNIKILQQDEVDQIKYHECIAGGNGLIYARKIYLDAMAKKWFAIVVNDYEAVMPVCYNEKLGIKYCYLPMFVQQLGLIHHQNFVVTEELVGKIKECLLFFLKYGDIHFNNNNTFANSFAKAQTNFTLNLNKPYKNIHENYSIHQKKGIERALKRDCYYINEQEIVLAIQLYKKYLVTQKVKIKREDYLHFEKLSLQLFQTKNCFTRAIKNSTNEVLSIGLFLKDEHRIYNIINATSTLGRKMESNYLLYHFLLEEFSEQNLCFDFEGSDLKGVKEFYQKFGAVNEPYYHWHFNELPKLLRLMKK